MQLSTKKPKVLIVGKHAAAQDADSVITLRRDQSKVVSQLKYVHNGFTS